jgi:galactose mutarotase-like enzyme
LIVLESSSLIVEVLPEVGGKIGQITDKASGRTFLVPPQRPYSTIAVDGDWLKHDTSGMDDCFPNVAAGRYPESPWNHVHLLDLGEWTHGTWKVQRNNRAEIVLSMKGRALPYMVTKAIHFVNDETLQIGYRVENIGQAPFKFLWSAHPLITVEDDFELKLPKGELDLSAFPPDGVPGYWPMCRGTRLSDQWIPHGATLKVFLSGLSEGWCSLLLPSHTLRFSFDLEKVPCLGLWFNNFGFPSREGKPFRCIAVEPCTSPSDLLDELVPTAYRRINPGESAEWKMRLSISPRHPG